MLVLSDGVLPIVDAVRTLRWPGDVGCRVRGRGPGRRTSASRSTVSRLVGQHELVTRPLPPEVAEGAALSGAAVLSDGQIALIIDCDAVLDVPVSA